MAVASGKSIFFLQCFWQAVCGVFHGSEMSNSSDCEYLVSEYVWFQLGFSYFLRIKKNQEQKSKVRKRLAKVWDSNTVSFKWHNQTDKIFNAMPLQVEISRFVIRDYNHDVYVFWCWLARMQRSDYYVFFANCHRYHVFKATLPPSFAVHHMLACFDHLLV